MNQDKTKIIMAIAIAATIGMSLSGCARGVGGTKTGRSSTMSGTDSSAESQGGNSQEELKRIYEDAKAPMALLDGGPPDSEAPGSYVLPELVLESVGINNGEAQVSVVVINDSGAPLELDPASSFRIIDGPAADTFEMPPASADEVLDAGGTIATGSTSEISMTPSIVKPYEYARIVWRGKCENLRGTGYVDPRLSYVLTGGSTASEPDLDMDLSGEE